MVRVRAAALGLFLAAARLSALDVPPLESRVNDYAGMISPAARARLEQALVDLERTDSTQIVVLTIPSLQGDSLEDFSIRVAEKWRIGQKKEDNGAILLVSRDDHAVRIEVGYGLEGKLTDLMAGRIVDDQIVPAFKAGRFDEGFQAGVQSMIDTVRGEYKGTGVASGDRTGTSDGSSAWRYILPFFLLYLVVQVLGSRRRVFGGLAGAVFLPLYLLIAFSAGWLILLLLTPVGFLLGLLLSGRGRRHWGGGRRGGFSGFGGGFGGFSGGGGGGGGGFHGGGGGFGGGGASGRW